MVVVVAAERSRLLRRVRLIPVPFMCTRPMRPGPWRNKPMSKHRSWSVARHYPIVGAVHHSLRYGSARPINPLRRDAVLRHRLLRSNAARVLANASAQRVDWHTCSGHGPGQNKLAAPPRWIASLSKCEVSTGAPEGPQSERSIPSRSSHAPRLPGPLPGR